MAKPIKETPVLKGKDACNFNTEINNANRTSIDQKEIDRIKANFARINAIVKR